MLEDILIGIVSDTGLNLQDEQIKGLLRFKINEIARELHETTDLVGSLDECILYYDPKEKQVALPYLIDEIRGLTWYNGEEKICMNDMRPLYGQHYDIYIHYLNWRDKYTHPFSKPIVNYSHIKFKIPSVLDYDINIKIIGRTENSERMVEFVRLLHGTLEVETQQNFVDVQSVTKDIITTYNIRIYDVEDNELGILPNIADRCEYRIIQVLDDSTTSQNLSTGVKVLFKKRFFPMVNDADEFICGPQYDKVLQWKFLFEYWSKMEGQEIKAGNAAAMVKLLLDQKEKNHNQGHEKPMEVKPNFFFSMFGGGYKRYMP